LADGVSTPRDADAPADWEPGMVILDTYEVKEELGRGGFGTVHKVHHKGWNVDLAVKSALGHVHDEDIVGEAEVWMGLGLHPNIVSCYFVRVLGGIPRIFVEYVEGGTLADWLYGKKEIDEDGKEQVIQPPRELTPGQRLGLAIEICRGMQHAHNFEWTDRHDTKQVGLVHRDLNPQNVLMTSDGVPRITDFGLVRFGGASAPPLLSTPVSPSDATLVRSIRQEGGFVGTPAYAAPEQWASWASVGSSADIYAFGVILYELLCGCRPFELSEEYQHAMDELKLSEYRRLHCEEEPPDPGSLDPGIDAELSALALRCLEKDPQSRPASFTEVNDRLKMIYQRLEEESYDDVRPEPKAAELLADSLNNQALSYLEIGQPKRAGAMWDEALKVDPHHPESTYNRGLVLWRSGLLTDDELVRQLEEVRTTHGDDWRDEYLLGLVHLEREDAEAAVQLLEDAAQEAPHDGQVQSALRTARVSIGQSSSWRSKPEESWSVHVHVIPIALSSDGRFVVSLAENTILALWNTVSGERLRTFRLRHKYPVLAVALSQDGHILISGSNDTLSLWDVSTGKYLQTFEHNSGNLTSVFLSSDGRVALASFSEQLQVWELPTGRCIRTIRTLLYSGGAALCQDGQRALTGHESMKLWDLRTGRCVREFNSGAPPITCVAISEGNRFAVSGHEDGTVRAWDLATGTCMRTCVGHNTQVSSVACSSRAGLALSAGRDVRCWDLSSGRCLRTLEDSRYGSVSVALSSDAHVGASAALPMPSSGLGAVHCWELGFGHKQDHVVCRAESTSLLAERSRLVRELQLRAKDAVKSGKVSVAYRAIREAMTVPGYSKNSQLLSLHHATGILGRATSLLSSWQVDVFVGHDGPVRAVAMSNDGTTAVSAGENGARRGEAVLLWALPSGKCLRRLPVRAVSYQCVAFVPGGHRVAVATDLSIEIYDIESGTRLQILRYPPVNVTLMAVAISADAQFALCGGKKCFETEKTSEDAVLRLWDLGRGCCVRRLKGSIDEVVSVAISANGRLGASGGGRAMLKREGPVMEVWDLWNGKCALTIKPPQQNLWASAGSGSCPRA
jgi:WD40 repeat protein/serine/threonine protein kinase